MLRGEATNNTVQLLNSVRLNSNKAQFGGGLFIAFYGNASGNTVTVDNAEVTENEVLIKMASSASGGGIFIGFAATRTNRLFGNVVAISSSRIISNEADIGGGISVNLVHNARECSTDSNKLLIENSTFDSNTAFQGSSAYLSQSGKCSQPLLNTTVGSSNFTNGHCGTVLRIQFVFRCSGNVLMESMPQITFEDAVIFVGNSYFGNLSALSLRFSSIELSSSAQLRFINNSAVNGAGIHLVGSSSIILNSGSTLMFEHNTASGQGGAIYADTCTLGQTDGLDDCVVKHSNPALHPDDWGVNITFIDNRLTSGQANAIYVDSVQSYDNPFNDTFCWEGWFYITSFGVEKKCIRQLIRSGPVYYVNDGPHNYTIYNGVTLYHIVSLRMRDAWGNYVYIGEVAHKIPIEFISGPARTHNHPSTLSSTILVNCSSDYTNQSSLLYVYPLQFSGFAVTIHFKQCGDHYCGCNICPPSPSYPSDDDYIINCLPRGDYCYSAGGHGACPSTYYICNYTKQSSCAEGREGILCGNCSEGYAVAINDPDLSCTQCNYQYGVAIFLLLQLVPVLIMLTLLAVLHIKITDGHLSGFVLFSQTVTLQFPGFGYSSWSGFSEMISIYYHQYVLSIPLTVYSIWNLNFLNLDPVPFCIPHIDTAAKAILLQYTTAACPLVFIVVTYTWIKCYNNGYRLVVYTTRPVHQLLARFWQKFKIQPSLIDTYAGLMLLSYMRFLATSVKLLKFTFVNMDDNYTVAFYYDANLSYFDWPHAAYGVLAILCLLVFVVTPTIFVLIYHLKSFQQCLTKCKLDRPGLHALVDAYQGCFKNSATDGSERRYFAGIYLLFRFCYVAFLIIPIDSSRILILEICLSALMIVVICFRPYKITAHNFTNLMAAIFLVVYAFGGVYPEVFIPILYIPFLALCSYLAFRLLKPCSCVQNICKNIKKMRKTVDKPPSPPAEDQAPLISDVSVTTVSLDDFVADDLYADRILNPDEYKEQ